MKARHSGLLAIVVAMAVLPAAAQTVEPLRHVARGQPQRHGSAVYPAGVNDPSGWNPSAPPMVESAVPMPSSPDTPLRSGASRRFRALGRSAGPREYRGTRWSRLRALCSGFGSRRFGCRRGASELCVAHAGLSAVTLRARADAGVGRKLVHARRLLPLE